MDTILKHSKRLVVSIIGITALIVGVIFFVLPGPGFIFVIIGLGVLATEFVWAENLLNKAKLHYQTIQQKVAIKRKK